MKVTASSYRHGAILLFMVQKEHPLTMGAFILSRKVLRVKSSAAAKLPKKPAIQGAWSDAAVRVLNERYLLKDGMGHVIETPDEAMWRVALAVAQAEKNYPINDGYADQRALDWAHEFYLIMAKRYFMPNSPTLMNAGKGNGLQLSACYVVPVEDSLEGIFDAVKHAALIHKSGGGTGMSFSRLRPKNSVVGSTKGVSSGPVSFMKIFDAATEHIKQGGSRRGANMGVLRVDHPDIMEFIDCKRTGGVTNFNISVGITNAFMNAFQDDTNYDLIDPRDKTVVGSYPAKFVMAAIIDAAWATGDPGLIFLDRVNESPANPTPLLETIETTNPCGEQPLGSFDACNLGSVNLSQFVLDKQGPVNDRIDWGQLVAVVTTAVRFLDDVIDINEYPLPQVREKVLANRRIGLGVMGWADMLFKLHINYDSNEALEIGSNVMRAIQMAADKASHDLALERGGFPNQPRSRYMNDPLIRNSNRTTVAPTGTISIIADCSSGIEPIFALAFQHRVKQPDGNYRVLDFVNPLFLETLDTSELTGDEKILVLEHVKRVGSLDGLRGNGIAAGKIEMELGEFVTAQEIEPQWHIRMQAAFQKYVDSAISKTINLPNSATPDDVRNAYLSAWKSGCLGITVFRDGCKSEQVLNVGVKAEEKAPETVEVVTESVDKDACANPNCACHVNGHRENSLLGPFVGGIKARPAIMRGYTRQIQAPEGKLNITVNSDQDGPFEVFLNVGRAGSDIAAMAEGIGRLISFTLRLDSSMSQEERMHEIARQLQGIGGSGSIGFGPHRVSSLSDAIARALAQHLSEMEQSPAASEVVPLELQLPVYQVTPVATNSNGHKVKMGNLCSSCGNSTLVREEGCMKCLSCGASKC